MPAQYPAAIYTPRTVVNRPGVVYDALKTKVYYAEDTNTTNAEIVAIENALGLSPAGAYTTVSLRIAAQEARFIPVKATGAEINTGTGDTKFVTPLAIADSNIAFLSDLPTLPVKASGAEVTTGTDDAKFATAKALKDADVNTRLKTKVLNATRVLTAGVGDVAYTGIGFTPTSIRVMYGIGGSAVGDGNGFVDSAKAGFAVNTRQNNATSSGVQSYFIYSDTASGVFTTAIVKSYDVDGFTLTWGKQGAPSGTLTLAFLCMR